MSWNMLGYRKYSTNDKLTKDTNDMLTKENFGMFFIKNWKMNFSDYNR